VFPKSQSECPRIRRLVGIGALCLAMAGLCGTAQAQTSTDDAGAAPTPIDVSRLHRGIEDITMTRWVDPEGRQPITYADWFPNYAVTGPFTVALADAYAPIRKSNDAVKFLVVVNSSLYPSIQAELDLYALDLTGEGYAVEIYATSGGTPAGLRAFLQGRYAAGTEGCILIGDLPVPWYETDFGDPVEHAEFPIDLFYMDMDGAFIDSDADGLYDGHIGDVEPEIWMGRLTASPLTLGGAAEIDLVRDYFHKDHLYRSGFMPAQNRALVYIDDDWAWYGSSWGMNVGEAYNLRTLVSDEWTTWGPDYKDRLPQDYEFIQVCVHSWPGGHGFKKPLDQWSWVYNSEIKTIQPTAHFYNLFACSNARYVEIDYTSGWYIFGPDHGLAAIGSAKTGSMLNFQYFYGPFGEGKSIGRAFMDWFAAQAEGGFDEGEITWFYGMTLNGDPTLTIQKKSSGQVMRYDDDAAAYAMPLPEAGGVNYYNVRFTPDQPCTLSSIGVIGTFPAIPMRMYVWASDGIYPTTVIDSVDIPTGNLQMIDLQDKNLTFDAGENFHIGFACLDPAPAETLWVYMDNGVQMPENRSGLYQEGVWKTLAQYYGANYNLMIRAEVHCPDQPIVTITSVSTPDGVVGEAYAAPMALEGGLPPYSWNVSGGALPAGVTLDPTTGVISGVPKADGKFHFTVAVIDGSTPPLADFQHLEASFTAICGDANSDAQTNVADAVFLVNYVFKGGPPPAVLSAADANCDGSPNVADAVYMINYVFKSGPEPCAGCAE